MALDNTFTKWLYYGINWNFKEWYVIRETIPNNEIKKDALRASFFCIRKKLNKKRIEKQLKPILFF